MDVISGIYNLGGINGIQLFTFSYIKLRNVKMKDGLKLILAYGQEVVKFRKERDELTTSANKKLVRREYDALTVEEVRFLHSTYDPYYMHSDVLSTWQRGEALSAMLAAREDVDVSERMSHVVPSPSEDVLRYVPTGRHGSLGRILQYVEYVEKLAIVNDSDLLALKMLLHSHEVIITYLNTIGPKTFNVALDSGIARYASGSLAYVKLPTPVRLASDEFTAAVTLLEPAYRLGLRDVLDIRIAELKVVAKPANTVITDYTKSGVYLRNGYYIAI